MDEEKTLLEHGVKPTAARLMILRTMLLGGRPLSMSEIGDALETVDKSVISRTLSLFRDRHLIHIIEDGSESLRYEVCRSTREDSDDDAHVHFHCVKCGRTFCLENIAIPRFSLPDGFEAHFTNCVIKGTCPNCGGRDSNPR